jgi:predicted ATPase/class 3 adenylate cyclase
MAELPSGTVTFLFTDLEGSTRLWEQFPEEMRSALARHDAILRSSVAERGGAIVKSTGDGIHAVFASAHDGLKAAVGAQRALSAESWPVATPIRVRMGLHSGEAEHRDGDYYGTATNRAARLMSVAHGGQVLVSLSTEELLSDDLPEGVGLADVGEHRLRDLSRPERVFQVIAEGLGREFPPIRSLDAYPGNLPVQLTSFVGRHDELVALGRLLREVRLVTVTGTGGVGKTRLAVQLAAEVLQRFPDGAWMCELAAASDDETMVQVVAAAIGARPRHDMPLEAAVVEFLRSRELLVVLDNCEHLLDGASRLVDAVLLECPNVRVIATSREGLGVIGEQVWPLRSLDVPRGQLSTEDAVAHGSVRLFAERAAAVRPDFMIDASNASAVVEICRRLDGIPLAIELAAARVSAMSTADVARHLDERFRLLTGGRRTAVERHQTLRATVDWSYSLLDERERAVFERLGVFAGSFDSDAAATVVAGGDLDAWDVLDSLNGLVTKSMVVAEDGADGATRYSMLETLRQYARERLDDDNQADYWRRRHAAHYATFAEEAGPALQGSQEFLWRHRLHDELDNLRAALTWALDSDQREDTEFAMRIVAALAYQAILDRSAGIAEWAERVIVHADDAAPELRPGVLVAGAWSAATRGDLARADRLTDMASDLGPSLTSLGAWGYGAALLAAMFRGDVDRSRELNDKAKALALEPGWDQAMIRATSVTVDILAGNFVVARAQADEQLELARSAQNPTLLAMALYVSGWASMHDDPPAALQAFDDSIALMRAGATDMVLAHALIRSALLRAREGDPRAPVALRDAVLYAHEIGSKTTIVWVLDIAVWTLADLDAPDPAAILAGFLDTGAVMELIPLTGVELQARTRSRERLRELLGDTRYDQLAARGVHTPYEELIPYLCEEIDKLIYQTEGAF